MSLPRNQNNIVNKAIVLVLLANIQGIYSQLASCNKTVESVHPCNRECVEGEEPMTCFYTFHLEWYQTMSKACYDCPYVESDCYRQDCITADGVNRPLKVVNRKMPGPAIEVCQNDTIIVDLENYLMAEGTTIHWHGINQKGTPYMDGVGYVTQCPIQAETTFRYQFNVTIPGTYFWHSHVGMQRADGVDGPLIVRKPKTLESHGSLYDYDRSEHVIVVNDWIHDLSIGMFTDNHHSSGNISANSLLVNGVGRFQLFNSTDNSTGEETSTYIKVARFDVEQGYKYRFRVINAGFLGCPLEMAVDGHNITVIATDGFDLVPITTTSLVTYPGERWDFIIEANNEIDNYWMRFRGLLNCDNTLSSAKQVAVLHYEGATDDEPAGDPTWEEMHIDGVQLNGVDKGDEDNTTISVSKMESLDGYDESLREEPDYQFYVVYDFYAVNNTYHVSPYYGYSQVKEEDQILTPQLNHISMKMQSSPLLVTKPSTDTFCNSSSVSDCQTEVCECTHVLSVNLGSVVEVVLVDEGALFHISHPFHLHGHTFRVVGQRSIGNSTTEEEVRAYDEAGLMDRNLINAPYKDVVTVPGGGYVVLRFLADNPGYWLLHCHYEFHSEVGMMLVFKVGEHSEMPDVPTDFPTCGSFVPEK